MGRQPRRELVSGELAGHTRFNSLQCPRTTTHPSPQSKTRLPATLKRQRQRQHPRRNEQRATHIDRRRRLQIRVDGHDRRHDAEDAVRRRGQRVPRAAILGGEDLGGVGVEDGVHDVAHEGVGAVPSEQGIRRHRRRGREQEDPRERGGEGQGALAAEAGHFHQEAAEEGAGDAEDGNDEAVAVGDVGRSVAEVGAPALLDVGQEGVVERETEADEGPDGHDAGGGPSEFGGGKEGAHVTEVDFLETTLQDGSGVGALGFVVSVVDLEVCQGEGAGRVVPAGDFVNDGDGIFVLATTHEEFGRFVEMEEEEATTPHEEGKTAHGDHEVPPAEVLRLGAGRGRG